jgi:carboxylesterase
MVVNSAPFLDHNPSCGPETAPFLFQAGETACLLIHGFTGTPWALRELAEHLAEGGITASAPLLPGHGTSPEDLQKTKWKSWVDTARQEFDRLRKRQSSMFVLGHSMGGSIALWLAAERKIDGIITLAAPVSLPGIQMAAIPLIRPFVAFRKKRRFSEKSWKEQIGYDRYPLDSVLELGKFLKVLRKRLSDVKCPILIVHGSKDRRIQVKNAERIFSEVGSAEKRKIVLDDPNHMITLGAGREKVIGETVEFIRRYRAK